MMPMDNNANAKMQYTAREMIKLLNVYLNHFPKHEKYGLCQEMRRAAYEIYALITECRKRYHKKTSLTNLDIRHEQLRMFVQLAFELGYFEFKDGKRTEKKPESQAQHRLNAISVLVNELGAMIGGWIKSVQS
jgi:four helix bundle protein